MTDLNLHDFQYFLEELEKNLKRMDVLLEQGFIDVKNMHVLHGVMSKMCKNWRSQLEHQQ